MKLVRYNHPLSIFDEFLGSAFPSESRCSTPASSERNPVTHIEESEDAFNLSLELPGIKKDELDIQVEKGVLDVRAESKTENEGTRRKLSYKRSFTLPENVQDEAISAKLEDGVLAITIPKAEAAKPRNIAIE